MCKNTMPVYRKADVKASEGNENSASEKTLRKPLCPPDGEEHKPMTIEETEFFGVCSGE